MNDSEILTQARDEIAQIEQRLKQDQARLEKLRGLVRLMTGQPEALAASRKRHNDLLDVFEMAGRQFPVGKVFDQIELATQAARLAPTVDAALLKKRVYYAVKALVAKKRVVRCPGGFQMAA